MTVRTDAPRRRAILAAVQLPGVNDAEFEASLVELGRLVDTLGLDVVGRCTQRRQKLDSGLGFGGGKLKELARMTGGTGVVARNTPKKSNFATDPNEDDELPLLDEPVDDDDSGFDEDSGIDTGVLADTIIVDHELSPMQMRNLANATSAEVMDRTGVIVEIFHRHASSREARLQVEIARLVYMAPRVRDGGGTQRQKGGIGQKGAGESSVELDRRKIRDRIAELKEELAAIEGEGRTRRARRKDALRVALVGYTNAGKSSLMRALTGSEVYVADKLFATLDTTVRTLFPETRPKILVSDTVGFIKKLPHDLVASFRSTLDEALEASLLLHVVDAADPAFREQYAVTRAVLADIGADDVPSLLVLNKSDKLDADALAALVAEFPDAIVGSAKTPEGLRTVRDAIVSNFERQMIDVDLVVPYDKSVLIGEIHKVIVLTESYEDNGVHYTVRAAPGAVDRLRALLAKD